jgi:hypothetical protein
MRNFILTLAILLSASAFAQTVKSKILQLKYTLPENWSASEFGGKTGWDESGNALCRCSGIEFIKPHPKGKMHVVVYPSSAGGLDSAKRNFVGTLRFDPVEKYEKTTNKNFSFEKRKSSFTDTKTNQKSYNVVRLKGKMEDHYYLIYYWQENMDLLNSNTEKELMEMVNAIEPL